jgi:O-antigen ligase
MHYLAAAFVLTTYPALVWLLSTYPGYRRWAYFFLGVLPFVAQAWQLDGAIINWATWPGYAKGVVVTVEDSLALAIITTHRKPSGMVPLSGFLAMYMAAVALSIGMAEVPLASFFYLFQLLRFAVVMVAVAKIAGDPRSLQWLAMGLASAMGYEAVVTMNQKFSGMFRAPGTMASPNELGMMAHLVLLPILGMLLAGYRSKVLMLGIAATLVVVVTGASRATTGLIALGIILLLLLSLIRRSTAHKRRMVGLAAVTMIVATPFLLQSISERLQQQFEHQSDYDERAAFERAAKAMWKDHPMGVGANEYVVIANSKGYSSRAGVTWSSNSRATNVHNTYLLVAAETGWVGLVTFVALIGAAILGGLRFAFGNRRDPRGDVALGSAIALAMVALHSKYEWITVTYQVQYAIAISFGIIGGLIRLRELERKQARRARATTPATIERPAEEAPA